MNYHDYLRSDEWQHLKLKKSKVAKLCFVCKRPPQNRNYHHARYTRLLTDQTIKDIRLACQDCHMIYHALKNEHPLWAETRIMKRARGLAKAIRDANRIAI